MWSQWPRTLMVGITSSPLLISSLNRFPVDSKRSSPSLLARQLRLRLVAGDDSDVPRNLHNIVVSIHAIATFQALHDYLRPRVAGLMSGGSRLSGMLAALAASGFTGAASRAMADEPSKTSGAPQAESSSTAATTTSNTGPVIGRRRSQRLSAKKPGIEPDTGVPAAATSSETSGADVLVAEGIGSAPIPTADGAPSDALMDSELHADFTDDEVDAEVFDEDVDPDTSISEKTITLAIAEGRLCLTFPLDHETYKFPQMVRK